jgi:hypothetical protein
MKQNSSIVFHPTANSLTNRYRGRALLVALAVLFCLFRAATAADKPDYLDSFDPAKGFKPDQRDLTGIYLQLAGSLEYYGSPEPYLRHVAADHTRIEALYRQKSGKLPASCRPSYMTDVYIDRLSANWNLLSPKLGLDPFAKEVGRAMRSAIKGPGGSGTVIVEIFKRHQTRVLEAMAGKATQDADFESLRAELINRLELDQKSVGAKQDDIAEHDASSAAAGIHANTMKIFAKLDNGLKPADAERIKTAIANIFTEVGEMAESELRAGIAEWAFGTLDSSDKSSGPYNASRESKLSADERKALSGLLSKERFTKADFAALDRFYSTAYEKLSERGKDELSKRVWAGTH